APARSDGKYGYINPQGKYVIDNQFESAQTFLGKLAAVQKGKKFGIINDAGHFVIPADYDYAEGLSVSTAVVRSGRESQYVIIQKDGKVVWTKADDEDDVSLPITSNPAPARVYVVTKWEADDATSNEALLTNRDPKGDTPCTASLKRYGEFV